MAVNVGIYSKVQVGGGGHTTNRTKQHTPILNMPVADEIT